MQANGRDMHPYLAKCRLKWRGLRPTPPSLSGRSLKCSEESHHYHSPRRTAFDRPHRRQSVQLTPNALALCSCQQGLCTPPPSQNQERLHCEFQTKSRSSYLAYVGLAVLHAVSCRPSANGSRYMLETAAPQHLSEMLTASTKLLDGRDWAFTSALQGSSSICPALAWKPRSNGIKCE